MSYPRLSTSRLRRRSAALLCSPLLLAIPCSAQIEVFETGIFDPPSVQVIPGYFGATLDRAGDVLVTGDREDGFPPGNGRAFVYTREGNGWSAPTELLASDGTLLDAFGATTVTNGDTVFVGAPLADAPSGGVGAVYTYTRQGAAWVQGTTLYAADPLNTFQFGVSLSVEGDVLAVGSLAPFGTGVFSGAVHVLERSAAGDWVEVAELSSPSGTPVDLFGRPVCVSGDTIAVGATGIFNTTLPTVTGEVSIFRRNPSGWSLEATPTVPGLQLGDNFGSALALCGDVLLVGALQSGSAGPGRAFVFERTGATWTALDELIPAALDADGQYGAFAALAGNIAVVSAPLSDQAIEFGGVMHIFERSSDQWFEAGVLSPSDLEFADQFGIDPTLAPGPSGPEVFAGSAFAGSPPVGRFYSFALRGTTLGMRLCAGSDPLVCPCGNVGIDTAGCAHSQALGGRLTASGSLSVSQDDLRLGATDLTSGQFAVPFASMAIQAPMPAGDGALCLGGTLLRIGLSISGPAGKAGFGPGLGTMALWQPGETWAIQVGFRDASTVCGTGLQWTSALALTFEP